MKKFLIYLVVILVAVSVGFTVFYLVRDNETISISTSNIYMRDGESIDDLEILYENKKSFSDYEVISSDESIASYDKETGLLTANSGGIATITFRTSNEKFRNLSCQVYVGDGSITSPYYIRSAQDLREIGAVQKDGQKYKYELDKCYKLINNINLAEGYTGTGYWIPIGVSSADGFTGNFDGNGYTISNINVNKAEYVNEVNKLENFEAEVTGYADYINAGLFSKIGQGGRVCNLKINNFNLEGSYTHNAVLGNVGVVAGVNEGTIERVEIISGNISATNVSTVGGVVGSNNSTEYSYTGVDEGGQETNEYVRYTARIDRVAANVNLGIVANYTEGSIAGASDIVGGLTGINHGGIVIYSYATGDVYLNDNTTYYGGIVGYNTYKTFTQSSDAYQYDYVGAHIKDTYSVMRLRKVNTIPDTAKVGGIVGFNQDKAPLDLDINEGTGSDDAGFVNKVIGNYYLADSLNYVEANTSVVDPDTNSSEIITTNFVGCGRYQFDGTDTDYEDTAYVIQGKTSDELKKKTTFKSHVENELVQQQNTGVYTSVSRVVSWKFDTIWSFDNDLNNGYPILNFANIEVSDDLFTITDGTTIKTIAELQNMKLDGHYMLANDLTFADSDIWTPIGTIKNPFTGSLKSGAYYDENNIKHYYKITNIKTSYSRDLTEIEKEEQLSYAGLFGVMGSGSAVENITLVNPLFANGTVVGGIAATNGFTSSATGAGTTTIGGSIENCHIIGGILRATLSVGGIAGDNYGSIDNCSVSLQALTDESINAVQITLSTPSGGSAGGIAGKNINTITTVKVLDGTTVLATGSNGLVNVGGIAGYNSGSIISAMAVGSEISTSATIDGLKGNAGGLVGDNSGVISSGLSQVEVYAPTDKDTNAGGIVGSVTGQSDIDNCLVSGGNVTGKNAGGIAGYVSYSKGAESVYDLKITQEAPGYSLGADDVDTIYGCGVSSGVPVKGVRVGGLAAVINNGIISHSYTQASLQGSESGAVKGGFAADLNLNNNSGQVGIIISCYTFCSFDGNGTNYSITEKEILQDPAFGKDKVFGVDISRTAGYCFNYAYLREKDGAKDPVLDDVFLNGVGKVWNGIVGFFDKDSENSALIDPNGVNKESTLKGSDKIADHLVNRGITTGNGWKHNSGNLPTRSTLDGLQNAINNKFSRIRRVIIPDHVKVTRNGIELVNNAEVTEGDVLIVTYTTTEKYSVTKFTIDDVAQENECKYVVGDTDVVIEYAEKLTHYDVEVKETQNGSVSVGAPYIKENTTVQIIVAPAENYVLNTLKVTDADGKAVTVNADNTFVMPSKKVVIEATFKLTYTLTIPERVTVTNANGDAVTAGTRVTAGAEFTVVATPEEGYVLNTLTVKTVEDTPQEVALTDNKFTMPEKDVVIEVSFLRNGTATKAENVTLYNEANEVISGTILEGTLVKIEVTPETNYIVDTITISTTPSGASVVVNEDGTFTMPDEDITISVSYTQTYALTIPAGVTVKKGETTLTATDRVVAGDELTITYELTDGYKLKTFTVNGGSIVDNKFTVSGDVVIVFEQELDEAVTE